HVREFKLNCLVLSNFFSKSLALFGISHRPLVSTGGDTKCLRSYTYTSACQGLHRKSESKTFIANAVFFRHFHILKHNGMSIASTYTHFVFLSTHSNSG